MIYKKVKLSLNKEVRNLVHFMTLRLINFCVYVSMCFCVFMLQQSSRMKSFSFIIEQKFFWENLAPSW